DKAMIAYESAADVSPVYIWIFQAQVQQIKTETFLQHYDGALESLHEMLRDSKNTEYFGIIHFEIANILTVQGKFAEAEEKYRYIDTAFARTEEAARSYYVLGRYFEYQMNNYDSARILYNKAKNEFPSSQITSEAVIKADIFNKHFELWKDLNRFDSLYTYELYKPEPVDSVTIPAHDSLAQKDTLVVTEEPKVKKMSKTGKQESIKDSVVVVDSVKIKERLVWEQSKSVLLDSLQRAIVRTKFELGGLFYLEIQQPDSAIRWFDEVIVKNPKSQFAPRALYTKAEIYRTLLQRSPSEREQIYRDIIAQYGDSPYANEARKNLGIPMIEMQKDTAMELFERAELLAEQKEFQSAVSSFKQLASRYVASPLSAKALYSAGWHYEHSLVNNDSAYSIYKRLVQQFPASQYSKVVQPKITEYDNELKRIETEKQKALDDAKRIEAEKQKAADDAKEKERQAKEVKKTGEKLTEPVINDSLSTGKPLESVSIDTLSTPKK
ncbi:MAG: tetratricopeptide repeat protein, partial [Bacteroidetes bacterium]|nr:tetratricopeptide repeat protein [Bacteroidota bacterium]